MAKRGSTGLCMVLGIDKPLDMSSHDVVNRVRRIFGERRVGHTGTLDPLASGALAVCVGPATRLDKYMVGHDKTYVVTVEFGSSTTTDDAAGEVIHRGEIPSEAYDDSFVRDYLSKLVGVHQQMPPVYSAIKVNGQRAYAAARNGNVIDLKPRQIEIYGARLLSIDPGCLERPLTWTVEISVSKGTYIRSIARDMGLDLGSYAHVRSLRRIKAGSLCVDECASLEYLEQMKERAAIDPVPLLGFRLVFGNEAVAKDVVCGRFLRSSDVAVFETVSASDSAYGICSCTGSVVPSCRPLEDGELISIVSDNKLVGIYRYEASDGLLKPDCVFSIGVVRGVDIAG